MKLILIVSLFIAAFVSITPAQDKPDRRVIEVTGSAERWITPDIFTFKITLADRIENKQKITIEQQETDLRRELTQLGVDVSKDLSIYDISSTYFRQKKIKDVLGTKAYRLNIRDLNKIAQLQDIADRLNVAKLDLVDTDISEMTRFRREVKIEAIQAAKAKAEYLLGAIGEKIGKTILVQEVAEEAPNYTANYSSNSNSVLRVTGGVLDSQSRTDDALSFSQTKLRFAIVAKFEIE